MMVHFDNGTQHSVKRTINYLKANRLMRAPHSVFSPDLAGSDFCLFGKLDMALMGAVFAEEELLQSVMEVLKEISREGLEAVFEE
jgi:hypothetical protein